MVTKKKTTKKAVKKEVKEVKEEIITPEVPVEETPVVEEPKEKKEDTVIGTLKWWKTVHQAINTVRMKALRWPVPKSSLPPHLQRWLTNKWYGTNVYMMDKEWLERHHVDMEKLEELKRFINDNYL